MGPVRRGQNHNISSLCRFSYSHSNVPTRLKILKHHAHRHEPEASIVQVLQERKLNLDRMLVTMRFVLNVNQPRPLHDHLCQFIINLNIHQRCTPLTIVHCREPSSFSRAVRSQNNYTSVLACSSKPSIRLARAGPTTHVTSAWHNQAHDRPVAPGRCWRWNRARSQSTQK